MSWKNLFKIFRLHLSNFRVWNILYSLQEANESCLSFFPPLSSHYEHKRFTFFLLFIWIADRYWKISVLSFLFFIWVKLLLLVYKSFNILLKSTILKNDFADHVEHGETSWLVSFNVGEAWWWCWLSWQKSKLYW